jgi:hypothetical protein
LALEEVAAAVEWQHQEPQFRAVVAAERERVLTLDSASDLIFLLL